MILPKVTNKKPIPSKNPSNKFKKKSTQENKYTKKDTYNIIIFDVNHWWSLWWCYLCQFMSLLLLLKLLLIMELFHSIKVKPIALLIVEGIGVSVVTMDLWFDILNSVRIRPLFCKKKQEKKLLV